MNFIKYIETSIFGNFIILFGLWLAWLISYLHKGFYFDFNSILILVILILFNLCIFLEYYWEE